MRDLLPLAGLNGLRLVNLAGTKVEDYSPLSNVDLPFLIVGLPSFVNSSATAAASYAQLKASHSNWSVRVADISEEDLEALMSNH